MNGAGRPGDRAAAREPRSFIAPDTPTEANGPGPKGLGMSEADTIDSVTAFHLEHYSQASSLQRWIDRLTDRLGQPGVVLAIILAFLAWSAIAAITTGGAVDQPPFAWLELAGTLTALMVSILILVTQRREDQLAERRAKLTLELALLADRKSSKIIALLEELRHDHPDVADRIDQETDDLAVPADPKAVIEAIDKQTAAPSANLRRR